MERNADNVGKRKERLAALPHSLRKTSGFPSSYRSWFCGYAAKAQPRRFKPNDGKPKAFRKERGKAAN